MDRRKEMEEYLKDYRTERLRIKKIYLENNLIKLESAFHEKLDILIAEQLQRQKEDNAVKLKNIFLCRLISSGYTESYETILGMSSVMLYMDEKKSLVYWYPELVYENIVQDMEAVEKLLRIKFLRLEDFELFFLKQKLLYDDWTLLQECFRNLFKQAVSLIMDSPLRLENEFLILSGDYMDNLKIIDHKVTERREE
ncbi:hypothetical protein SAMN05443270_3565 [Lacrimispora sphenoides]|uniref:hypothetical protein n=1 Tax=Lacrimispora sphenoides TaxID=29370 RepID=UPI0008CEA037|nr:hypothetical protein [Lacrimispora sphenoides]SEU23048.1 hypothetical protein SAMN05443270_3565 [Lacrimispora sphenoides]